MATLAKVRAAARSCTACPLWQNATQTVFGEGSTAAHTMLVGEQPGDQEDLQGKPFVGPAEIIKPKLIVCLGATAATTLLGRSFKVTAQRGKFMQTEGAQRVLATVHPSSILRSRDADEREAA